MGVFLKICLISAITTATVSSANFKNYSPRILGGNYLFLAVHPHLVSLRQYNQSALGSTQHFCGGAILNKRWVITAAWCTSKEVLADSSDLLIAVGKTSFQSALDIKHMHRAEQIILHPEYTGGNRHDISLIRTDNDIKFDTNTQPIKISKEWIGNKKYGIISGWGLTDVSKIIHIKNFRLRYMIS